MFFFKKNEDRWRGAAGVVERGVEEEVTHAQPSVIAPKVLCSLHEPAHFHFHFSFFYFFLLDSSLGPPLASRTFCGEEECPFLGLLHQKQKN